MSLGTISQLPIPQSFVYRYSFFLSAPRIMATFAASTVFTEGGVIDFPSFGPYKMVSFRNTTSLQGQYYSAMFYPEKSVLTVSSALISSSALATQFGLKSYPPGAKNLSAVTGINLYNYLLRTRVNYLNKGQNLFLQATGNSLYAYLYDEMPIVTLPIKDVDIMNWFKIESYVGQGPLNKMVDSFPERKMTYKRHMESYFDSVISVTMLRPLKDILSDADLLRYGAPEFCRYQLDFKNSIYNEWSGLYSVLSYSICPIGTMGLYKVKFAKHGA